MKKLFVTHTDQWFVWPIRMGFCMQNHKFPAKLHKKFKIDSNNHPKIVANKNTIMQQHHNSKKSVNAWTKSLNDFKGNEPLTWKTITQRSEQNQNHHQRKKWTAKEHRNNNNHDRTTGTRTDDRNTRVGKRRRTSGWEKNEEKIAPYEMWEANALYGRLTLGFYSNEVKGIFYFSSSVLGVPAKMLDTPSNTLNLRVWNNTPTKSF